MKPAAQTILPWLKANLGPLGALTGADRLALQAAAQLMELYAYCRGPALLNAFAAVIGAMQESTRHFAYHVPAHVMEWTDRAEIWSAAALPWPAELRTCKFEPGKERR